MRLRGFVVLCLVLRVGPALAAERRAPVWPQDAWLSAGADQMMYDRPPGFEESMFGGHVHLEWPAASDDVKVVRYRIFRDGRRVAQVGGGVTKWDRAEKRAKGRWSVRAGDAAGNWSPPLAADVRAPMESFSDPVGDTLVLAPPRAPNVRLRVGRRDGPAFFEKAVDYHGEGPLRFELDEAGLAIRIVPGGDDWRMTVVRVADGDELATLIANDPLSAASLGSCQLDTNYEHNGGLWIELGIAGTELSAARACEQITTPR